MWAEPNISDLNSWSDLITNKLVFVYEQDFKWPWLEIHDIAHLITFFSLNIRD
jgi:hypothetical protein